MRIKAGVVAIERRAIGADHLRGLAHVEKDMRVVEWRHFPHAHELLGADLDHREAGSIVNVGNDSLRHGPARLDADVSPTCARMVKGLPP
jgi:hypothetical protein